MLNLVWLVASITAFAGSYQGMPAAGVYVNEEGYPLLPALQNAQHQIDIEVYTMKDSNVREELRAAMQRGVHVRIIKESRPVGEKCDVFSDETSDDDDCADQQHFVSEVRDEGGVYEPFNRSGLCPREKPSCLQHGKIAVIDEETALLSTGNFDESSLCIKAERPKKCNRDYTMVLSEKKVVRTLQKLFDSDLAGEEYDLEAAVGDLTDRLTVSPNSMAPLVKLLKSARNSIDLQAQYLKDTTINNALLAAAKRGVKIRITVASFCAFGSVRDSDWTKANAIYSAFDAAGIETRIFNSANKVGGHSGYMHAKVIVVDDKRAWIGSVNGSTQSLTQNREYGLIFDNPEWVKYTDRAVEKDHDDENTESWEESLACQKDHGALSGDDLLAQHEFSI